MSFEIRFRVFLLVLGFFGMLATVSAAPTVMNLSQPVNFTAITWGYCRTTAACQPFLFPPLDDCNSSTCNCTDTMSDQLAACLQCGYDNIPGLSINATQAYMNNFTSGCQAQGTPVKSEVLSTNGAGSTLIRLRGAVKLAVVGVSVGIGMMVFDV